MAAVTYELIKKDSRTKARRGRVNTLFPEVQLQTYGR